MAKVEKTYDLYAITDSAKVAEVTTTICKQAIKQLTASKENEDNIELVTTCIRIVGGFFINLSKLVEMKEGK